MLHRKLSEKPVEKPDIVRRLKKYLHILRQHHINIVCLSGYGRPEYLLFLIFARLFGIPTILFAESWYTSGKFRTWFKKKMIRFSQAGLFVSGSRAKSYFSSLGIPQSNIFTGYSVVDNNHFFIDRKKTGYPYEKKILCVARFSPEKNLPMLIEAFKKSNIYFTYKLILVGGGPDKQKLIQLTDNDTKIELNEWVSYDELPNYYNDATIFILPSLFEPWGLVVNEAMAAGLPVIVSQQCGCVPELVSSKNGFVFDANYPERLTEILDSLADRPFKDFFKMGFESQKIIASFTPGSWAKQLVRLTDETVND